MRAQEKQDEAWEKQLTSCQLFFLGLILPFPSPLPVFPEPLPFFHRGLSYEKVFPSFVYLLRKKITSVGKIEEKGKMHTVSSQDFRSLPFSAIFLVKIMHCNFFCEIATFTCRLLSFDNFLLTRSKIVDFFMSLNPILSWKLGISWMGLNGFKFSR